MKSAIVILNFMFSDLPEDNQLIGRNM